MKTNQQNTENPYPEIFRKAAEEQFIKNYGGCCNSINNVCPFGLIVDTRRIFIWLYRRKKFHSKPYWVKNQYYNSLETPIFGADKSLKEFRTFLLLFAAEFYTDETQQKRNRRKV